MTFLAEWGDRSQLATIVLAGINDVAGVCVGGVAGHCVCTGAAVLAGALVAKRISPRTVTVVGAIVFIAFACASLILGPGDGQEEVKIELTQEST
jgi:putative Ca2+/H+ antiporter (TMEM165/GDT1 family)